MRYHGQGFEIAVAVDPDWLAEPDAALDKLAAAFDAEHERLFSFLLTGDHELVNARATVSGPRPEVAPTVLEVGNGDPAAALVETHPIHLSGRSVPANVYDRAKLRAGDVVTGPAIVIEMDSTTLVLPGHAATVHPSGSLLINPEPMEAEMADIIETATGAIDPVEVDPVTLDLIENSLRNARYEMDEVLFRTALSPGIREQHDEFPLIADPSWTHGGRPVRTVHPGLPGRLRRDDRGG